MRHPAKIDLSEVLGVARLSDLVEQLDLDPGRLPEADVDTILRRNPVVLFVRVPTGWSRDASQLLVALSLTRLMTPLIGEPAAWRAGVGS